MSSKDGAIETLRGVAIVLLVSFHVIGAERAFGIRVEDDSHWRHFCNSVGYLRMPLFTAISGWVYSQRPVRPTGSLSFIGGKARRLLVPMVACGVLFWLLHQVYPLDGTAQPLRDIGRVVLYQYIHFWYLQALFTIFLLVVVLELVGAFSRFAVWGGTLAVCFWFSLQIKPLTPYFSFQGFGYLLPYFVLGVGVARFPALLLSKTTLMLAGGVAVVLQLVHEAVWFQWLEFGVGRRTPFGAALSTSATLLLFGLRWHNRSLARLGAHSFCIFLFHPIFYAGVIHVFWWAGLESPPLVFVAGLLAGLFGPIGVERLVERTSWTRLLFLGQNPRLRPMPTRRVPLPSQP